MVEGQRIYYKSTEKNIQACPRTFSLILKPETSETSGKPVETGGKPVETDGKPVETSEKRVETDGKTQLEWKF